MSIIAYAPAPPGANLADGDTIDLTAGLAAIRGDDLAHQARALLDSGASQTAAAAVLGVSGREVLELWLDDFLRERGAPQLVGMRTGDVDEQRPAWLNEACPSWCQVDHRHQEHPDDRTHMCLDQFTVDLTRYEPVRDQVIGRKSDGPVYSYALERVLVSLYRPVGNPDAEIEVGRDTTGPLLSLTVAEARGLAAELVRAADLAEGGDR